MTKTKRELLKHLKSYLAFTSVAGYAGVELTDKQLRMIIIALLNEENVK